jgi:hypothetical protein
MLFALSVSPFLAAQEGGEESTATTEQEVATAEVAATSDMVPDVSSEGGCNCGGAK